MQSLTRISVVVFFFILAPESILHERIDQQIEMEMKGIVTMNVRFK